MLKEYMEYKKALDALNAELLELEYTYAVNFGTEEELKALEDTIPKDEIDALYGIQPDDKVLHDKLLADIEAKKTEIENFKVNTALQLRFDINREIERIEEMRDDMAWKEYSSYISELNELNALFSDLDSMLEDADLVEVITEEKAMAL